ncbi:MAG: aspartate aminotransferase family protein [Candidatus Tectomicrobia bacterium]|uniref:Aspartate aminotransferase family protein n=1 Tax=Tectimicrobiota bacterium TaxID=2528274 RepID=A0A937VXX5_UNCTE|nr:aspartate aminotransferase family protein [Candidatus Tectomicrobia bacterium]
MEYGTMALENAYRQALPASQALFERAQQVFPDGVTHDNRRMQPFPVFVERADGAYKWDVDGRQYIDYWMGHGALIMGHNPPHVRDAVIEQAARGTHYGANHPLEVTWAEWVCKLVPCAEHVRFTASGTESTHMALRLARAYTGKRRVIKFAGHFHGWHEGLEVGVQTPYETAPEPGQMQEAVDAVALCPPNDIAAVRQALAAGDVAAIILEPTGGHFGTVPLAEGFLRLLREEASRAGVVLIFDEVVTGFRVAPGGAQALYGVTPDLSTFAKILAGGLPGGAVAGRADLFTYLATPTAAEAGKRAKIHHPGTFNANPLSAAAGVAMLSSLADGAATRRANEQAAKLRYGMNDILARAQVSWKVYGQHSDWKLFYGADSPPRHGDDQRVDDIPWQRLDGKFPQQSRALRQALILEGVDFNGARALVGTCHTDEVVTDTLTAFARAVQTVKAEGLA